MHLHIEQGSLLKAARVAHPLVLSCPILLTAAQHGHAVLIPVTLLIKCVRPLLEVSEATTFEKMSNWVKFLLVLSIFCLAWKKGGTRSSSTKSSSHISRMTDSFSTHCDAAITSTEGDLDLIGL